MRRGFARGLRNEEITELLTDDDREERHYVLPPAGDQDSEDEGHGADSDREEGEPNHPPILAMFLNDKVELVVREPTGFIPVDDDDEGEH